MGASLLDSSLHFSSVIDSCDQALAELHDGPVWRIRDILRQNAEQSLIHTPLVSQITCTALQIGLVEIWRRWGLVPQFVIGHSSGEIAAFYAAGVYTLRDAIIISYYKGKCIEEMERDLGSLGAMCAIGLNELDCNTILERYKGHIVLAAVNSPNSCTLSGDRGAINDCIATCKNDGIFCRKLLVDVGKSVVPHEILFISMS